MANSFERLCTRFEYLTPDTCWILGAGASYDCLGDGKPCIPLAGSVLDRSFLTPETITDLNTLVGAGRLLSKSIETAIGTQLESTLDELRGISESDATMANIARSVLLKLSHSIRYTLATAQLGVWRYEVPIHSYYALNYLLLAMCCCHLPRWSVITLNYDEALDWAFRLLLKSPFQPWPIQYGRWLDIVEYGKISRESSNGVYAKPHGSLGLFECLNEKCSYYRKPLGLNKNDRQFSLPPDAPERSRLVISDALGKCPSCGADYASLLLPPGKNKSAEEGTFLESVFATAEGALAKADNWLLLGYSFPDYDADVRDLIKRAARRRKHANKAAPKIWVVAPDARAIAERVSNSTGVRVTPMAVTFSGLAQDIWRSMGAMPPSDGFPVKFGRPASA